MNFSSNLLLESLIYLFLYYLDLISNVMTLALAVVDPFCFILFLFQFFSILCHSILFHSILFYSIFQYRISSYKSSFFFILFCPTLFSSALSCPGLSCFGLQNHVTGYPKVLMLDWIDLANERVLADQTAQVN